MELTAWQQAAEAAVEYARKHGLAGAAEFFEELGERVDAEVERQIAVRRGQAAGPAAELDLPDLVMADAFIAREGLRALESSSAKLSTPKAGELAGALRAAIEARIQQQRDAAANN